MTGGDAELVRRIAVAPASSTAEETELIAHYVARIRIYGRRHLRDPAAVSDFVQDVIVAVLEAVRAGRVDDPDRIGQFILGTCRYQAWSARRGAVRRTEVTERSASERAVLDQVEEARESLPPTISRASIARLEGRGMRLLQTRIDAGTRAVVTFGKDVDLLVHRLQLDVGDAQRIDCEVVNAADGSPIIAFADVPFERTGEINLVCHRHYAEAFPPDASIRLVAVDRDERRVLGQFGVLHVVV